VSLSSTTRTDEALLAQLAAGDPAALRELYERHEAALFAYLLRLLGDREAAAEALQETLVTAWRRAETFAGRSSVRTWLCAIARRQALRRRQGQHRELTDAAQLEALPALEPGPEERALAAASAQELGAVFVRLSLAHQEVLTLAVIDELTYAEIAEVLSVPVGTVRSRLHLAKRKLAAELIRGRNGVRR